MGRISSYPCRTPLSSKDTSEMNASLTLSSSKISFDQYSDKLTFHRNELSVEPRVFSLSDPSRIVIDLPRQEKLRLPSGLSPCHFESPKTCFVSKESVEKDAIGTLGAATYPRSRKACIV